MITPIACSVMICGFEAQPELLLNLLLIIVLLIIISIGCTFLSYSISYSTGSKTTVSHDELIGIKVFFLRGFSKVRYLHEVLLSMGLCSLTCTFLYAN